MKPFIFIPAFLLLFTGNVRAWGEKGHRIVAAIARGQMEKDVIDLIDYYLKGVSWEDAACWMDQPTQNKKFESQKPMHLVTLAKDKTFVKSREPSIINQLDFSTSMIQKRNLLTMEMVAEHIKMVFHLVADLHQPLHAGYPEDKNGTSAPVKFNGKTTDLHTFWDSEILEQGKIDVWKCSKYIFGLEQKERTAIQKVDYLEWLTDTRSTLAGVYEVPGGEITPAYIEKNAVVAEKQLSRAALRLIALLNSLFK
jgi:hypothetical protein